MSHIGPAVSIIIPAYNAAWCIRRAVDSALAQDWQDREILVVDDGSNDNTGSILTRYGPAVRVIRQENAGLSSARNTGIRNALGEYVALLDADDWWFPTKLSRQMERMLADPGLVFCSTATRAQNLEGAMVQEWPCGKVIEDSTVLERIFEVNAYIAGSGSAVLARRQTLLELGGFDVTLPSLEDIDMWMRLAAVGPYACVEEPLTVILKRTDSMSGNLDCMRSSAIRVMKKNRHLLPPHRRGGFWRAAYAAMLSDYAKWEYRSGHLATAVTHLLQALALAPRRRGRLITGLLLTMLRRQTL